MAVMASGDEATKCIPSPVGGLPAGTRIQDYCIKGVVGEGGFAIVYLADDVLLNREVAIKEYMPAALAVRSTGRSVEPRSASHGETFTKGMRSFINEARMLAQFKHVALIDVLRFWEENGTAYMAMPYYRGKTLREIFRETGFRCDEAWLRRLIEPILSGLQAMHRENCFHRDISTDNVIVLAGGNPVLLDFGAARRIVAAPDQLATIILKPGFAPIEQYSDDVTAAPQGPWTDIYALCAVCYFAISGRMPTTSVARIIRDPVVPLTSLSLQGFSPGFLAAIDKGLAVHPEDRPQTVKEFAALLDRVGTVGVTKPEMPGPPRRDKDPDAAVAKLGSDGPAQSATRSRVTKATRGGDSATAGSPGIPVGATPSPKVSTGKNRRIGDASERTLDHKPPQPMPAWGRRNYSLLVGAGLALCLVLLVAYLTISSEPKVPPLRGDAHVSGPAAASKTVERGGAPPQGTQTVATDVSSPAEASAAPPSRSPSSPPEPRAVPPVADPGPSAPSAIAPPVIANLSGRTSLPVQDAGKPVESIKSPQFDRPAEKVLPRPRTARAAGPEVPNDATRARTGETDSTSRDKKLRSSLNAMPSTAAGPASIGKVVETASPGSSKGAVDIHVKPWGMVAVDGRSLGVAPPLRRIWLTVGKHSLVLTHPRGTGFATEITVAESGVVEVSHDFAAPSIKPR